MIRGILIAGNESSLFTALANEAVKRVETFASAVIPNRFPMPAGGLLPKSEPAGFSLSWNPASPISARTLVLAAENRLERISDAVLVCSPPAVFRTAEVLTPEEIDILVNDHMRGWFFLVRELALYFQRVKSGTLSFVAPEFNTSGSGKNVQTDMLGPSASASFRAFAQGIFTSSANESFLTMGFTASGSIVNEDFSAWLFKIIDEGSKKNSGRWNKFAKLNFFR